jgi:hypothetical protein
MIHLLSVVATSALLLGCFGAEFGEAALQQASSGFVGCRSAEIAITNDDPEFNQRSWDANCRGHLFHCFGAGRGSLSCVEDIGTRADADRHPPRRTSSAVAAP